jgi:hypothetical protein
VVYDEPTQASYMVLQGSEQAFRTRVRGFRETDLEKFYSADPGFWRSRILLNYTASEISSVSVLNHRFPEKSFHLSRDDRGEMKIAEGLTPQKWSDPDPARLNQYLAYFADVRFEFLSDSGIYQHEQDPEYVLVFETTSGQRNQIGFYPLWTEGEEGEKIPENNILFASLNQEADWLVVKYVSIDLLLKEYEYFQGFKK